jgi:hypothetical protein
MAFISTWRGQCGLLAILFTGIAICFCVSVYLSHSDAAGSQPLPTTIFLTVGVGKTHFSAPADQLPPVQVNNMTAYRAFVCTSGNTKWVGYLERYTPEGKAKEIADRRLANTQANRIISPLQPDGIEVNRPADVAWIKLSDIRRSAGIMDVRCPTDPGKSAANVAP